MRLRLASLAPRVKSIAPLAITTAAVMTAATGASAVTVRLHAPAAAAKTASARAHHTALSLPAPPTPAAQAPSADLPTASRASARTSRVPRPAHLFEASLLVTSRNPLTHRQLAVLRATSGVHQVQSVAAGSAVVDGHRASVLGVNPARFRPWTPRLTAGSQALWQSIARGELTASFDMGHEANLPLGSTVAVYAKHHTVPMRIGAFASVGMAGVDAVVSKAQAGRLGLREGTGVVLSAPNADPVQLRQTLLSELGPHVHALLLRQVIVIRDAGEFLTRDQINTVLQTAAHEVGKPYVWGAEGPDSFDCSGLVQWSFAAAGIRMPRVSQQQWFAGPHVNYSDARPGDLLFWHYDPTDPTDIDHVAIYAGNGMMLVAPHTGDYVKYVPVPLTNLAGVVRVDPAMAGQIAW